MKKILLYVLILLSVGSIAQNRGDIVIEWNKKTALLYGNNTINIPQFNGESYLYDPITKTVIYRDKLTLTTSPESYNVSTENIVYESISINELGDLPVANLPEKPLASILTNRSRNSVENFLTISPIIKDEFGVRRIRSFSYQITGKSSNSRTSTQNKTSNTLTNSVLASGDWYRFYIEKSGVYKISKKFLDDLGLNTNGIDPKRISLYGAGGRMLPLSNSINYPNDLTENAIQVIGEEDGSFNNEDYILFYGEGI